MLFNSCSVDSVITECLVIDSLRSISDKLYYVRRQAKQLQNALAIILKKLNNSYPWPSHAP